MTKMGTEKSGPWFFFLFSHKVPTQGGVLLRKQYDLSAKVMMDPSTPECLFLKFYFLKKFDSPPHILKSILCALCFPQRTFFIFSFKQSMLSELWYALLFYWKKIAARNMEHISTSFYFLFLKQFIYFCSWLCCSDR